MRALIQRVSGAAVRINGEVVGSIGRGLVIFVGITHDDNANHCRYLADKCVGLRVFADAAGKMNLSLSEVGGEALIVSQFTLYGDSRKGRRPSYTDAADPELATPLYLQFIEEVGHHGITVATGRFGAEMEVEIHNDGPVTLMLESRKS